MQSLIVIILIGLAGGIAVGLQSPLSSMISQRLGVMESVFIIHLGGALAALIPLLIYGGGKLGGQTWKLARRSLVRALCRSIWACGDLLHELHDSPCWNCNLADHSSVRTTFDRNRTGLLWAIGRSAKTHRTYAYRWLGCCFSGCVAVCEISDCLISPLFDHKGTKSQRLEEKNFVSL